MTDPTAAQGGDEMRTEPLPEPTDNSVKPDDGEQDVDQDPASVYDAEGNKIAGRTGA